MFDLTAVFPWLGPAVAPGLARLRVSECLIEPGPKMNRRTHALTRRELYDMVWAEPVVKIAERYGISGNGLAKICRKAAVPLPPRGYWAKMQHGHKPRRVSLRPAKSPDDETVRITEGTGPRPAPPAKPDLEPPIAAAVQRALVPENRITVSDGTARLHRLVLEMSRTMDRPSWDGKRKAPDEIEQRRRRVLDAFLRGVERAKGTVERLDPSGFFNVASYGSSFRLSCSEPERRVRVPLDAKELRNRPTWETRDWRTESQRSGILRIRVLGERDRHRDFEDKDGLPLEDRLTDVLVYLLKNSISVQERQRREEAARLAQAEAQRLRLEDERRRWDLEERRRRERERVAALVDEAARWRRSEEIRAYVAAASATAEQSWITWALGVADDLDPLTSETSS